MEKREVGFLNSATKSLHPHIDFDVNYTFYYDETNNIKKLHVSNGDLNTSLTSNFVLGGFAHTGTTPDIRNIFEGLKLQKTVKEVKLKHIAYGEFLECLKSTKLTGFLEYLIDSPLYFHYSSLNLLFFSIVDIVDSALVDSDIARFGFGFDSYLKDCLYKLCKFEIKKVIEIFHKYQYPNIKKENIICFIDELTSLFDNYRENNKLYFGLASLKQLLKASMRSGNLLYIMNETDYVLLKDLTEFYIRPIYTFLDSNHFFDNEASIEDTLRSIELTNKGRRIENFSFLDSKDDLLIQVSDIVVGLAGKLSHFINSNSTEEVVLHISNLNSIQLNNLDLYLDMISKSHDTNPGFIHQTDSQEEQSKLRLLYEFMNKKL